MKGLVYLISGAGGGIGSAIVRKIATSIECGTIIAHYAPGINEELRKIQDKEERGS